MSLNIYTAKKSINKKQILLENGKILKKTLHDKGLIDINILKFT